MNALKYLRISLTSALMLAAALPALAAAPQKNRQQQELSANGGDNSGGGNTLNHKLIEKYVIDDPSSIKGYAEFQKRLDKISESFPAISASMKERLENMDWYVIPKDISQLPAKQTGLHFKTEQPVYQTRSEIFLSKAALEKMSAEEIGDTFIHEGVMALGDKKQSDQVRPVIVRLLSDKSSPEKIQSTLLKFNLGPYFTPAQMKALVRGNEETTFYKNALYQAEKLSSCTGKNDDALIANAEEMPSEWIGTKMDLAEQLRSREFDGSDIWVACGLYESARGSPICREVGMIFGDEDRIRGLNLPNIDTRLQALKLAGQQYQKQVRENEARLMEKLSRSNAYLTLMAMTKVERQVQKDNLKELARSAPEQLKVYEKLKAKIDQRRAQLDFSDTSSINRLRCNSFKALAKEYRQDAPESAQKEYPLEKADEYDQGNGSAQ